MRIPFSFLLMACIATGQISVFDLTTNGDGSVAYFSTSLPRANSGDSTKTFDPSNSRIFQVTAAGVQLYMERPPASPEPTGIGGYALTNYYSLSRPETSRDGSVFVVTGQCKCFGGGHCTEAPLWETTVSGATGFGVYPVFGSGRLSGNGRYLLTFNYQPFSSSLIDMRTGKASYGLPPMSSEALGAGRVVADDGTVVYGDPNITLVGPSSGSHLPAGIAWPSEPVIDSAANLVVYSSAVGGAKPSIHVYRIQEQRDATLVAFPNASAYRPFVTADGRRVMFLSNASGLPQIYVVNIDSTGLRQVSRDPTGVTLVAMSDDGKVGWYFSGSSRLYQMNLDTGEARERMGQTLQAEIPAQVVPGSAYSLVGTGFGDDVFTATSFPLPRSLGGVSVGVNGVDAPLYSVSPQQITLQIPWETESTVEVIVHAASTSPFYLAFSTGAQTAYAALLTVIHQNWQGLVTPDSPAEPGEILHLYGTGFGPVDPKQTDGVPASTDPAHTIMPITCSAYAADYTTTVDFPVLFAGLAPGFVGYYQMDIRVPVSNLPQHINLTCSEGTGSFSTSFAARPQ
jgi:uncharacterized protein (TIGR03437 family)